jgi:hypothetical protein
VPVSFDEPATRGPGALAAESVEMPRIPRPAKTRYPVDLETYRALKEAAVGASALRKGDAEVVSDKRGRRTEVASMLRSLAASGPAAAAPSALTTVSNFGGLPHNGWNPYDGTLAAGPEHVMVAVNERVGFYTKSSGAVVLERSLGSWFRRVVTGAKIFDPKVLYDQYAGRWVLLAMGVATNPLRSWFLLSVSESADPRGRWFNYALDATLDGDTPTNNWADYPGLGVDKDALYVSANMFRLDDRFQYAKLRVIPKKAPYSGGTPTWSDFVRLKNDDGTFAFTVQPCHTYGSPGVLYLVNTWYPTEQRPTRDRLSVWSLRDPLGTPRLTRKTIKIAPYSLPPQAEQKGGGGLLDSGDIRVLNAVYSGGSVWCVFTTAQTWSGTNRASFCWLQLRPSEDSLLQQGIFGARDGSYFYPAVMPDVHGNVVITFSRSSRTEFASMYYTGRETADPAGKLRPSVLVKAGAAHFSDGNDPSRWGDYSGAALDPADSRTIWIYNGYAATGSTWATQVAAARF